MSGGSAALAVFLMVIPANLYNTMAAESFVSYMGIGGLEDRRITQVSGGQLQRACICRALMNDPELLFADEPTGALNRSASEEVMEVLLNCNAEGTTTLIVTHDSTVASLCQRVIYLADGMITGELELGTYEPGQKEARVHRLSQWLAQKKW